MGVVGKLGREEGEGIGCVDIGFEGVAVIGKFVFGVADDPPW